jgi:multicomponent Na+:H+ antiporter subunit D
MPAIAVVMPLVASFFVFLIGRTLTRWAFPLALSALAASLICSIKILLTVLDHGTIHYWLGGWQPPYGIEYRVDHLNALMLVLISFLSFVAAIYAYSSVKKELPDKIALFWAIYLLLITGLLGIIITADLFNLFVLLEVASLSGYALVAIGKGKAAVASFRYLVIGTIGASFYLLGVGYLYLKTGSLNMADLRNILPDIYETRIVQTAFVFIFIGFGIKIALFPLHAWQPDAYTLAPSAVSVIISTAAAKTFVYALIRVIFSVFTIEFINTISVIFDVICWLAAIAMIAGSILAIAQQNFKRMLAYSSVANVGYIVLAIGLAPETTLGLTPAVVHILNHALIKGCMFMVACAFIHQLDLWDIRSFTGLGRTMPYSSFMLIVAALAMVGMPPGAGFISKWYLIAGALDAGRYFFVVFIFFSTLLMIVYFWRVIETMYIRVAEPSGTAAPARRFEAPPAMLAPTVFLGLTTFVMGIVWMSDLMIPYLEAINADLGIGGGMP